MCGMPVQEITCFDNNFFGIREDEVKMMAPNQRLILEDGYACLRKPSLQVAAQCRKSARIAE